MRPPLTELIRCPQCGGELLLEAETKTAADKAWLSCRACCVRHPIVDSVPRFVANDENTESFGLQWNEFACTQLDSRSGVPISRGRFFAQTGWRPEELADKLVLDAGCGAGRFAEVALSTGANVVAVDSSSAVAACVRNLGDNPNLNVIQADINRLPLKPASFHLVYCFGVLQHTPNPRRAFQALVAQCQPGGRLAVDIYPKSVTNFINPKYLLRPITIRVPPQRLIRLVRAAVPWLLPLSDAIGAIPLAGGKLRRVIPVANYREVYPLSEKQLCEWAVLDTFDMFSPVHDHPQSAWTIGEWFAEAGFKDVEVFRAGVVVGRGTKHS